MSSHAIPANGSAVGLVDNLHESHIKSRRVQVLSSAIAELVPENSGLRLLDVGCGDGQILKELGARRPDIECHGIDTLIRPNAAFRSRSYDGVRIPYEDRSFDVVVLVDVLHHAADPRALLAEAARVCSGNLIIKDHLLEGLLAGPTLAFMDRVGNRRFGVELPYHYLRTDEWMGAFSELDLAIDRWTERIGLYPFPLNLWFERHLHFLCRLSKSPAPAAPSQSAEIEVSVVMPCLNEAATLPGCLARAQSFFARTGISGEVVVADNGSVDGSAEVARRLGATVVNVAQRGYGAALYHGTVQARGRYVIMGDADGSYDFGRLDAFVDELRRGSDLVVGNRFRGGILGDAMPWKNRYIGNPVLSWIGRQFFDVRIGDFHCGLRGYSKRAFLELGLVTTGMEFASEMIVKAALHKLKISEVPTTLSPDGRDRAPHLRPWRDGWRHLRFLLMLSPYWLFFIPGLVAGLGAGALVLRLAFSNLTVGNVQFAEHTLLFCGMLLVLAVQAVFFSVFAEAFYGRLGVYPMPSRTHRLLKSWRVEYGLVCAAAMLFVGVAGAARALGLWAHVGFSGLTDFHVMRTSILSMIATMLGMTILMNSFYLGILDSKSANGART